MDAIAEIANPFASLGADFVLSATEIGRRLETVRAFLFDWDGVFNDGAKGQGAPSTFSEQDSMGTNMLRYAYWRARGELPVCAVVSGADNPTARLFAEREHFDAVYSGFADKTIALEALCEQASVSRAEIAYMFDDLNDLSVANGCALRFLVRRDSSPLLREYTATRGLVDYVTAAASGQYPVREVSELLLGLLGGYPDAMDSRTRYDDEYQAYFTARQSVRTSVVDAS